VSRGSCGASMRDRLTKREYEAGLVIQIGLVIQRGVLVTRYPHNLHASREVSRSPPGLLVSGLVVPALSWPVPAEVLAVPCGSRPSLKQTGATAHTQFRPCIRHVRFAESADSFAPAGASAE